MAQLIFLDLFAGITGSLTDCCKYASVEEALSMANDINGEVLVMTLQSYKEDKNGKLG